jgi:hypothetical protein
VHDCRAAGGRRGSLTLHLRHNRPRKETNKERLPPLERASKANGNGILAVDDQPASERLLQRKKAVVGCFSEKEGGRLPEAAKSCLSRKLRQPQAQSAGEQQALNLRN